MTIAIIGYGRFGSLAARYISKYSDVLAAGHHLPARLPKRVRAAQMIEAAGADVVILAVPINAMPSVLKRISRHLQPGAIVIDVCSVKEKPVEWMTSLLPPNVSIVGAHPLFGPDSAADSVKGRNIVLCPARRSRGAIQRIRTLLNLAGVNTFVMTPEEHDRLMASTLFLTQLIGHSVDLELLPESKATTDNFEKLRRVILTSKNDTAELFRDMYRYNRFARKIPQRVMTGIKKAVRRLT